MKLRGKFGWDEPNTIEAIRTIGRVATVIKPAKRLSILSDEADNHTPECALDAHADIIVTGDRHLLRLKSFESIAIVRLLDFLRNFPDEKQGIYLVP